MTKGLEITTKLMEKQGGKSELRKEGKKDVRKDFTMEEKRANLASSHPVKVPIPKKSRFLKELKL